MDQNKVDIPVWGGYDRKQETDGGGGNAAASYRYYKISLSEAESISKEFSSIFIYYPTACCGYITDGRNVPFRDFNIGQLVMTSTDTVSDLLYIKDLMVSCAISLQSGTFFAGNSIIEFTESLASQDPTLADVIPYLKDHEISEEEYNAFADSLFNNN